MGKRIATHPVLGRVQWDKSVDSWEANIDLFPGCTIGLSIVAEGDWAKTPADELFEAACAYLDWVREVEPKVRKRIADDLLDCYNRVWADEDPEEGTPPMNRKAFLANVKPSGINLYHDGSATWYYSCGDLFGGHGIWLMVGPDRQFKGKASLIG